MTLLEKIEQDLVAALKQKNSLAASALRMVKSRVEQERKSREDSPSDEAVTSVLRSQIKRHKESLEAFVNAGRQEQAAEEKGQMDALSVYLPAQISTEVLTKVISQKISDNQWKQSDFGLAMKTLKTELGDQIDGQTLSATLKAQLQN